MCLLKETLLEKNKTFKPVWFMRQAGRYLPEFREIRSKNTNFINLCLNSKLSSEITLQPLKRFNLDAAIIFSDILLIPYVLGQQVNFIGKNGPTLSEFNLEKFIKNNEQKFIKQINPVYEAIKITRNKLNSSKSLIAFIGAPWTLIIYMLNLKESKKSLNLKLLEKKRAEIRVILDKIVNYLCTHIENQVKAGADVIQIFDSWAGLIPDENLEEYCYEPNKKLVQFCKEKKIPVICFPKGLNKNYLNFNETVKPDGISLDYEVDPIWAKKTLTNVVFQGGMSPKILLKNDKEIYDEAKKYMDIFSDVPYIFNLGHGLLPETNPETLGKLVNFIKENNV